jgi:hypothetical protein
MVGGATALLRLRLALAAALLALFGLYYATSELLPQLPATGAELWVDFLLTAVAMAPIYLALGIRSWCYTPVLALAAAACAAGLYLSGATLGACIPKLATAALVGFLFLRFFERLSWIVLIALLVPVVDTVSVWRGPTHQIVTSSPQVFDAFAVAFPVPGERNITLRWLAPARSGIDGYRVYRLRQDKPGRLLTRPPVCTPADRCGNKIAFTDPARPAADSDIYRVVTIAAGKRRGQAQISISAAGSDGAAVSARAGPLAPRQLAAETAPNSAGMGVSDVIFFALFLAAAARFGLRPFATWVGLVASLGLTALVAYYADPFGTNGLPALPGLSLAFLLVNADLICRRLRTGETVDHDRPPRPVPLPRR